MKQEKEYQIIKNINFKDLDKSNYKIIETIYSIEKDDTKATDELAELMSNHYHKIYEAYANKIGNETSNGELLRTIYDIIKDIMRKELDVNSNVYKFEDFTAVSISIIILDLIDNIYKTNVHINSNNRNFKNVKELVSMINEEIPLHKRPAVIKEDKASNKLKNYKMIDSSSNFISNTIKDKIIKTFEKKSEEIDIVYFIEELNKLDKEKKSNNEQVTEHDLYVLIQTKIKEDLNESINTILDFNKNLFYEINQSNFFIDKIDKNSLESILDFINNNSIKINNIIEKSDGSIEVVEDISIIESNTNKKGISAFFNKKDLYNKVLEEYTPKYLEMPLVTLYIESVDNLKIDLTESFSEIYLSKIEKIITNYNNK